MIKEIYDLTVEDLKQFPVWYFPMGDFYEDQLKPALTQEEVDTNTILVKTNFKDQKGNSYLGYIYWRHPEEICYLQPGVFVKGSHLTFYGAFEPDVDSLNYARSLFPKGCWPIEFESEEHWGLKPIKGVLEGLYYLDEDHNIVLCQKVWE